MSNEVDWTEAPDWAKWHAVDEDGTGCWFSSKPYIDEFWGEVWLLDIYTISCLAFHKHFTVDNWKKSLTKRP